MILQSTLLASPLVDTILSHPVVALIGIYVLINVLTVCYRLSPFHPLARVPGPKWAAATWWYKTYWELWRGGAMTAQLHILHEKYGPVVRYAPNEVHFTSKSAYLHIYGNASKALKDPVHYHCLNADESSVSFCDPQLAKERREIILPFFARRNVIGMQYVIEDKLCSFTNVLRSIDGVFDLGTATKHFTNDVIMEFCFAKSLDTLHTPGFQHPMILGTDKSLIGAWVFKHFPLIKVLILKVIPDWLTAFLMPGAAKGTLLVKRTLLAQVDEYSKDPEGMASKVSHEVIFNRLLGVEKYLKKGEDASPVQRPKISKKSLYDEAVTLMFGGTDTVGNTLSIGTFYILNTPGVLERLMDELRTVWPGNAWEGMPNSGEEYKDGSGRLPVSWEMLEKLPYLTGVIKESLRMSNGVVSAMVRLAPAQGITVDGWKFPAGTGIASANPFIHNNPEIFPAPETFNPERWIGPGAGALDKYLVAFSKGPRQCVGMNLAWCELFLTFATMYRRFEFELVNTSLDDLKWKDYNLPIFQGRIKVRAKPRYE